MRHARCGIPIEHLRVYLTDCRDIAPYIISVGCGNGVYEYEATRHDPILRSKLILVDPNPESYELWPTGDQGFLKPAYATVNELIKKKPEVIGNCILLLIWIDMAERFDFEAFETLKPLSCVCMNEHTPGDFNSTMGIFKRNFLLYLLDPIRFAGDSSTTTESPILGTDEKNAPLRAFDMCNRDTSCGDFMGCSGSVHMNLVLITPESFDYKTIVQTRYGCMLTSGQAIYPRLTWIAKKGSKIPSYRRSCLGTTPDRGENSEIGSLLQREASSISDIDINGRKTDSGSINFHNSVRYFSDPLFIKELKKLEKYRELPLKKRH